jgi:hypothetical protein
MTPGTILERYEALYNMFFQEVITRNTEFSHLHLMEFEGDRGEKGCWLKSFDTLYSM